MEIHCPSCQRRLTIPDQYAGQMMKCPLCNNTFQAPALAPVPAPATAPPPPLPPVGMTAPPPLPTSVRPEEPSSPPSPPGDYVHHWHVWISPRVVPWVVLGLVVLVFVLTFFPWLREITILETHDVQSAWGSFEHGDGLLIVYDLLLVLLLLVSIPAAVVPLFAGSMPPGVRDLLKWRYVVVGGIALLSFLFLVLQLLMGFHEEHRIVVIRTAFLTLAFWLHLLAILCCLLALWADFRGNRPVPRLDILW
jgi:hypothetical protein